MADYSNIPELAAQQAGIERRRKIAEMIQAQSMKPLESQQVPGGYVVPTSPLLGIGKVLEAYLGKQAGKEADTAQLELGQKAQGLESAERQKVADAVLAQQEMNRPDANMTGPMQGIAPTLDTQQERLLSINPVTDAAQKERELRLKVVEAARTREDAQKAREATMKSGTEDVSIGDGQWQTYVTKPDGTVDMSKPIGQPFAKKATASESSVNVGVGENEFEKELGKKQAAALIEGKAAADDAVQIIDTVKTGREILNSGMVSGFGADFIVGTGQALKQAGIDFGGDATANSQAFTAAMAQNVGKIIKLFGAGTGLSDADREYATKMAGGLIKLDKDALLKILDINERGARNVIRLHNKNAKGVKSKIPLEVQEPQDTSAFIEIRTTKDGRKLGKKPDGTIEEIK